MAKPSVVYPNAISLIALMLHSLQIIGQILKSVSPCFPYFKLGYSKEQYSLIVMDIFKDQDNAEIKELCSKMTVSW